MAACLRLKILGLSKNDLLFSNILLTLKNSGMKNNTPYVGWPKKKAKKKAGSGSNGKPARKYAVSRGGSRL